MARWALVIGGKVREIFQGEEPPVLHPDLMLVDVSAQPDVQENFTYVHGVFSAPPSQISAWKVRGAEMVDAAAERARLQFITPGAGQAMTYLRKLEEARAQQAGGPGPFPLLAATIGIDGPNLAAVAAVCVAMGDAWANIAAAIETTRLGAKAAIEAVQDGPDAFGAISAIVAGCAWPSP